MEWKKSKFQNHVVAERRFEQIGVLRFNDLPIAFAQGFGTAVFKRFEDMLSKKDGPDPLAWAQMVYPIVGCS
jgi:hypothetical protein